MQAINMNEGITKVIDAVKIVNVNSFDDLSGIFQIIYYAFIAVFKFLLDFKTHKYFNWFVYFLLSLLGIYFFLSSLLCFLRGYDIIYFFTRFILFIIVLFTTKNVNYKIVTIIVLCMSFGVAFSQTQIQCQFFHDSILQFSSLKENGIYVNSTKLTNDGYLQMLGSISVCNYDTTNIICDYISSTKFYGFREYKNYFTKAQQGVFNAGVFQRDIRASVDDGQAVVNSCAGQAKTEDVVNRFQQLKSAKDSLEQVYVGQVGRQDTTDGIKVSVSLENPKQCTPNDILLGKCDVTTNMQLPGGYTYYKFNIFKSFTYKYPSYFEVLSEMFMPSNSYTKSLAITSVGLFVPLILMYFLNNYTVIIVIMMVMFYMFSMTGVAVNNMGYILLMKTVELILLSYEMEAIKDKSILIFREIVIRLFIYSCAISAFKSGSIVVLMFTAFFIIMRGFISRIPQDYKYAKQVFSVYEAVYFIVSITRATITTRAHNYVKMLLIYGYAMMSPWLGDVNFMTQMLDDIPVVMVSTMTSFGYSITDNDLPVIVAWSRLLMMFFTIIGVMIPFMIVGFLVIMNASGRTSKITLFQTVCLGIVWWGSINHWAHKGRYATLLNIVYAVRFYLMFEAPQVWISVFILSWVAEQYLHNNNAGVLSWLPEVAVSAAVDSINHMIITEAKKATAMITNGYKTGYVRVINKTTIQMPQHVYEIFVKYSQLASGVKSKVLSESRYYLDKLQEYETQISTISSEIEDNMRQLDILANDKKGLNDSLNDVMSSISEDYWDSNVTYETKKRKSKKDLNEKLLSDDSVVSIKKQIQTLNENQNSIRNNISTLRSKQFSIQKPKPDNDAKYAQLSYVDRSGNLSVQLVSEKTVTSVATSLEPVVTVTLNEELDVDVKDIKNGRLQETNFLVTSQKLLPLSSITQEGDVMYYKHNTYPGDSGATIWNANGEFVGYHVGGNKAMAVNLGVAIGDRIGEILRSGKISFN